VRCLDWPVVAACVDEDTPEAIWGAPLIVVHAGRVVSCSAEARAEGVRLGSRQRDAQQACPGAVRLSASPERDQRVFDRLLTALGEVVPLVGVLEPGLLHLGATGMARYYGSEVASAKILRQAVLSSGIPTRVTLGFADTLFAATQAAHSAAQQGEAAVIVESGGDAAFLAPFPIDVLDDPRTAALCHQLGLHTLGAFAALPRPLVTERFGLPGVLLHQLACGEDPRHQQRQDIPASLDVAWRAETPCESSEQLAFAVSTTVEGFLKGLLAHHLVAQAVEVTLVDDDGQSHVRVWSHPRYFSAAELVHRVRWQSESLAHDRSSAVDKRGIVEARFRAPHPHSAWGQEDSLWGSAHRDASVVHAVSNLQARLGHTAVAQAAIAPGHTWADRQQRMAWGDHPPATTEGAGGAWAGQLPAPSPATVFSPPLPVEVRDDAGAPVTTLPVGAGLSAAPRWMLSGQSQRQITAWAGPWPVMERWWDAAHSRFHHRIQLLDERGVGWLASSDEGSTTWVVEARYD
jgi:protein ImuB